MQFVHLLIISTLSILVFFLNTILSVSVCVANLRRETSFYTIQSKR